MPLVVVPAVASAEGIVAPRIAPAGSAVAAASAPSGPDAGAIALATLLLAAGTTSGLFLQSNGHYAFTPAPGVSGFAMFYVVAQALERITELVSVAFPRAGAARVAATTVVTKREAIGARDRLFANALNGATVQAVEAAADAQAVVDRIRQNRTLIATAFTIALAMAAAGLLGLRLIAAISASPQAAAPAWLDLIITGLAIGGGTKPLHDLIARVQDSRRARQDPAATGGKPQH